VAEDAGKDRRSPVAENQRERESVRRLKEAMARDELTLYYQPIFDAAQRRPLAVEALLRWREPERQDADLHQLLEAAERSPVIFDLENWAMRVCFRDAATWTSGALPDLRVNLNLSAREFQGADLVARLQAALGEARLAPGQVILEITETSAIHDPVDVARTLEEVKAIGAQLWLDDFGTGHSSLAWLSWFPIDGLKIPGLFVTGLPADRRSAVITSAVIEMAHRLGLRVTAEGIENEAQLAFLRERGCDALQGFLLAEPVTAADLTAGLASR
jgi:EAL domain-containing protein (putative c-di-GMP-specific phosphodiesterase class I)